MQRLVLALWADEPGRAERALGRLASALGVVSIVHRSDGCTAGFLSAPYLDRAELLTRGLPLVRQEGYTIYISSDAPAPIRYALCDLDGTLLACELLALLAERTPYATQMRREVQRAMAGEVDFRASLVQRTRLFAGLGVATLEAVFATAPLAPDLSLLLECWRTRGIRYELATGNYHLFAQWAHERLGCTGYIATEVELCGDTLTGRIAGEVVDAAAKAAYLERRLGTLSLTSEEALAIGDGANDLSMLAYAGHSLLYSASPSVGAAPSIYRLYSDIERLRAAIHKE